MGKGPSEGPLTIDGSHGRSLYYDTSIARDERYVTETCHVIDVLRVAVGG